MIIVNSDAHSDTQQLEILCQRLLNHQPQSLPLVKRLLAQSDCAFALVRDDGEKLTLGLSVMKSSLDGAGCFANIRFPRNSPIAEYAGERITHSEARWRMRTADGKRISELEADCYIDGSVGGNDTQYINHSCEPNADVFIIDGFMIVFALREIEPGEEITVDYLNSFEEDRTVCQCRAASCRQRIDQQAA